MRSTVREKYSSGWGVYTKLAFLAALVLQIFAYDLLGIDRFYLHYCASDAFSCP
jgi:hypothetical protein